MKKDFLFTVEICHPSFITRTERGIVCAEEHDAKEQVRNYFAEFYDEHARIRVTVHPRVDTEKV